MRQGTGASGPANKSHYLISREENDFSDEGWFIITEEHFMKVRDVGQFCQRVCTGIITPGNVLNTFTLIHKSSQRLF